jgi:hypothetical protein
MGNNSEISRRKFLQVFGAGLVTAFVPNSPIHSLNSFENNLNPQMNQLEQEQGTFIRALHLVSPDNGLLLSEIAEVDTNFITNEYYPQLQTLAERVRALAAERGITVPSTDGFLAASLSPDESEPQIQATLVPTPTNENNRLISAYFTLDGQIQDNENERVSGGVLFKPNSSGEWDVTFSDTQEMVSAAYGVSIPDGMVVYPVFDPGTNMMNGFTRSLDGVIPPERVATGRIDETTGRITWETYFSLDHAGEYAERIGQIETRPNVRWENGASVDGDVLIHDVFSYNGVSIFMEMPVDIDLNFTGYVPDSFVLRPTYYHRLREMIDEYFVGETGEIHLIYIPDWNVNQDSREYLTYQYIDQNGDPTSAYGLEDGDNEDVYVRFYVNAIDVRGTEYEMYYMTGNQQVSNPISLAIAMGRDRSNRIMNPFSGIFSSIILGEIDSVAQVPELTLDTAPIQRVSP